MSQQPKEFFIMNSKNNDFPLLISEEDDGDFPLLLAEEDLPDHITCEQAAARKRQILQMGRDLKQSLGRSMLSANPGIFVNIH